MGMMPDAAKDALIKGEVDYVSMGWENGEEEFVALDPENNEHTCKLTGHTDGILFNTLVAPYDDPAVRRALRDCLDLQAAADVVKVGYEIPTKAGIDAGVYSDVLAPDLEQSQDVEAAKAELADAGWSIENGQ